MKVDPNLPCAYCCGAGPFCGSTEPDHDDMGCDACAAEPLSEVHPECWEMVRVYMEEVRRDPT